MKAGDRFQISEIGKKNNIWQRRKSRNPPTGIIVGFGRDGIVYVKRDGTVQTIGIHESFIEVIEVTHALGTTPQDIEAKVERKREVQRILHSFKILRPDWEDYIDTIRKYIEEN